MLERGVFLVLARLELLGLVFGDLGALGLRLDLESLALDFDLRGARSVVFQRALRRLEFLLQCGLLSGYGVDLVKEGLQTLVALLQEKKFLQNFHHAASSRLSNPVRPARIRRARPRAPCR